MVAGGAGLTGLTYIHPLLLFFLVLAVWALARKRRGLLAAAVAGIFLIAWPPFAWLVVQPLEVRYPKVAPSVADAEAIVVLASGVLPAAPGRPEPEVGRETYQRCRYAAWLYKNRRQAPMVTSGGPAPMEPVPAARVMRDMLVSLGVPESQVWLEDRSRSTYENAVFTAELLRQKGLRKVALVTDACHMPRAERCFRKQGLQVIAVPCGFTVAQWEPADFLPDGSALLDNERTLHEYLGLGWYLIKGRM